MLGLDRQSAIIFGGAEPEDSLYVLNLNNYEWNKLTPSGRIPPSRMFHTANVIGKYMVVLFGKYCI